MWSRIKSLGKQFRYDESELPFLEHLDAFRSALVRMAASLLIGMLVCLPFADDLIRVLRAPAEPYIEKPNSILLAEEGVKVSFSEASFEKSISDSGEVQIEADVIVPEEQFQTGSIRLQFSEPAAALKMWLLVSFFGGLLISLPFLIFFLALFILPGIRDLEQRLIRRISLFSGFLFFLGVYMGYEITLPLALDLMLKIGGKLGGESIWFYSKYITFSLQLLFAFGLAFQLPVVILILGKMGLVGSTQLRDKRRHVIVGLLILSMLLTPPDLLTQLLLAAPLILLYEFCIWFLYLTGNRQGRVKEIEESEEE